MFKAIAKKVLSLTPYRVVQTGHGNRFSAIDDAMHTLRMRGYAPKVILDGGANLGDFAAAAHAVWPQAVIHAAEPQPGCIPFLEQRSRMLNITVHPAALGSTEGQTLKMAASRSSTSTGAHVLLSSAATGPAESIEVPVRTIDSLMHGVAGRDDRLFIKLDLQGFELEALKGSTQTLPVVEVILAEVSFFAQAYEPPIEELIAFLYGYGFRLHDVASISARRRDNRAHQGDLIFVAGWSELLKDRAWS